MRGTTPDWDSSSFARLAELILQHVADGGTVVDGARAYEVETNGLRSCSANRYKWTVKLSKEYAAEYEVARQMGAQVQAERAAQRNSTSEPSSSRRRAPVVRIAHAHQADAESTERYRISQRDLIRYLRNVEIVGSDSDEIEQLKQQLSDITREHDQLKHEHILLSKKYEDAANERDQLIASFQIARKHAVGVDDTPKRMVVNGRGEVVAVERD